MSDPYGHDDWTDEQKLQALAWAQEGDWRTIHSKPSMPRLSVHDFGATGDGRDDTAAFVATIMALGERGGGQLFIPAGDYRVDWSKMPSVPNIHFMGESRESVSFSRAVSVHEHKEKK